MEMQGDIYFDDIHIPYRFDEESGKLTMYFGLHFIECESSLQKLRGNSLCKGVLFFLSLPLSSENFGIKSDKNLLCGTITVEVKFYIEDFDQNIKYNTMYFEFMELDNLLPSKNAITYNADTKQCQFNEQCIKDFNFTTMDNIVKFEMINSYSIDVDLACSIKTRSYIKLSFLETDDYLFLSTLFVKIKEFFMLIYNRQNINLFSVNLHGVLECSDKDSSHKTNIKSKMHFLERHSEPPEKELVFKKQVIRYNTILSHFTELFEMVLKNKVLVYNLHTSLNAKSMIDLKQSIQITSSFEYYQREFTPAISSEYSEEVYNDVRQLVLEEMKKYTGKNKKTVKNIAAHIKPMISLQDKICKIYNGYKEWHNLDSILGEMFNGRVAHLAETINNWRNELAHAKCEIEPKKDVVDSIRLLEFINYCIIFRKAGYSDQEIKIYIEDAMLR